MEQGKHQCNSYVECCRNSYYWTMGRIIYVDHAEHYRITQHFMDRSGYIPRIPRNIHICHCMVIEKNYTNTKKTSLYGRKFRTPLGLFSSNQKPELPSKVGSFFVLLIFEPN